MLYLIRLCQELHTFPQAGGLLDQDSLFIHFLQKVVEYDEVRDTADKIKRESQRKKLEGLSERYGA